MFKTKVIIDGMMCGMCESHINDAIRREFKVKKVTSSHSKGVTEIMSDSELDREKLQSVIDETGYKVMSIETTECENKKGFHLFGKKE